MYIIIIFSEMYSTVANPVELCCTIVTAICLLVKKKKQTKQINYASRVFSVAGYSRFKLILIIIVLSDVMHFKYAFSQIELIRKTI